MVKVTEMILKETANLFKALAQSDRLRILYLLTEDKWCQCELVAHLGKSQSTISNHLKKLVNQGILVARQEGQRHMYYFADTAVKELLKVGQSMVTRRIQEKADQLIGQ